MSFDLTIAKHSLLAGSALVLAALPCTAIAKEQDAITVTAASESKIENDPYTASSALMRLEEIGFQLSSNNADKCSNPEKLSGLIVHDISDYDMSQRPAIIEKSNLSYGFGILGMVPGSPAELAGFKIGDEIISINGSSLRDQVFENLPPKASYARIEGFTSNLASAMQNGPVELQVLRAGRPITLYLTGVSGCGGRVSLQLSNKLNAWSDGRYVAVTTRMMHFAKNDNELAFVVAHEMAHNIKNHAAEIKSRSALLASFGLGAAKFYKTEAEADDFAISLLASTKFDLSGAPGLLGHFSNFSLLYLSPTHPSFGRRMEIVTTAISRISKPTIQVASFTPQLATLSLNGANDAGCAPFSRSAGTKFECDWTQYNASSISLKMNPEAPWRHAATDRTYPLSLPSILNDSRIISLAEKNKPMAQGAIGLSKIYKTVWLDRGLQRL